MGRSGSRCRRPLYRDQMHQSRRSAACSGGTSAADEHYMAGVDYGHAGRWADALVEFNAAIPLDPDFALLYVYRAAAHVQLGNAAAADFGRAIELDPTDADSLINRGLAHYSLGNLVAAIADFSRASEINPEIANAHASRAATHARLGNLDAAIADADRALAIDLIDAASYVIRATAHFDVGNIEAALVDIGRAIDLDPEDPLLFADRSFIYCTRGRHQSRTGGLGDGAARTSDRAARAVLDAQIAARVIVCPRQRTRTRPSVQPRDSSPAGTLASGGPAMRCSRSFRRRSAVFGTMSSRCGLPTPSGGRSMDDLDYGLIDRVGDLLSAARPQHAAWGRKRSSDCHRAGCARGRSLLRCRWHGADGDLGSGCTALRPWLSTTWTTVGTCA